MADITQEAKDFFAGLTKTLQDAITAKPGEGDDDEEAKKAAADKEAADKEAADKAAKAKADAEGDNKDDPPDLTKRVEELEGLVKQQVEDSAAIREALDKTLDTVEKLADASAVKKSFDTGGEDDDPPTEDALAKSAAKDRRTLDQAVVGAARGAKVRLE